MSKQSYRYPRDEFDNTPEDSPVGVHRVPRSAWHKVVPFVAVAAVFAVVAYVGVTWWADGFGGGSSASADDKPVATHSSAPAKSTPAKSTPTKTKAAATTTDDASSADVDHTVAVAVKNPSTGIAGAAAADAKTLTTGGFKSVTAGPYSGTAPAAATVYYKSADQKATAEEVAKLLQIDTVTQLTNLTTPITVVLAPKG